MMRLKSIKIFSWIASIGLVGSALFFSFIILFPVDVLTSWRLNIANDKYALGETALIESLYDKNVQANGTSSRYLECENKNHVFVRYLLNEAVADRQAGNNKGTGVMVVIPRDVAEITLPTTCYFSISIAYDVAPRRAEPEYARTKDFTLYKALPAEQTTIQSPGQPTVQPTTNAPATQSTPPAVTPPAPTHPVQPAPQTVPPAKPVETPQQGLVQTLLGGIEKTITNLIGGK